MLTITATPQAKYGTVFLEIETDAGNTLQSLTRSDPNGTYPVRMYSDQDIGPDGLLFITDAEASLTGTVFYNIEDTAGQTASTSISFEGMGVKAQIAPAVLPSVRAELAAIMDYSATHPTTSVAHTIIGRRDRLVNLGLQSSREGSFSVFCHTYQDVFEIEEVLNFGEVLLLRQPDYPGLDMYMVVQSLQVAPFAESTRVRHWQVQARFVEVAHPTSPLVGSVGWTYAQSQERNATFAASAAEFETFADLTRGPVTTL